MQKRKEYCRYGAEGKLSEDEVQHVCRRTDVVSYGLMAEMSHFQKERVADFTEAMRGFLRNQVSFYRQVGQIAAAAFPGDGGSRLHGRSMMPLLRRPKASTNKQTEELYIMTV